MRLGLRQAVGVAGFAIWLLASSVLPAAALDRREVAVIINAADPLSEQIGTYYARQRRLLFQNIIRVSFQPGRDVLTPQEFATIRRAVEKQAHPNVQAYVLTWAAPFRVACMSITSAFAFGYDPVYCEPGCGLTKPSPYFNSAVRRPYAELKMRPTMALAALSFEDARALIDRGVAADGTFPKGTAYLVSTTDRARNVRSINYPVAAKVMAGRMPVRILKTDVLQGADDVFFYFTGLKSIDGLKTLRFVPGAVADHLTSTGGALTASGGQMSVLRWLEAGATGSYGTVVEPCNRLQKFPDPAVVALHYLAGETLIEAYWKGVAMPGQGIFVGEPLAAPFRPDSEAQ